MLAPTALVPRKRNESARGLIVYCKEVPSIDRLLHDGRACRDRIAELDAAKKGIHKKSLLEWLSQSERLWVAAEIHKLKGRRFHSFADELGVDRSSAYNLMKLHPERAKIIQQCETEGCWPGWKFCFEWLRIGNSTLSFAEFGASGRVNKPKSDEWGTPHDLFARCEAEHGRFTCDVATSDALAKCDHHYTKEVDGLKQTWKGICWLNPPLSLRDAFAKKAYEAALDGCKVIGLFPAFTDASWFHEFASHARIEFLRGRPQFVGPGNGYAPFGFMVCVWTRRSARRGARLFVELAKPSRGYQQMNGTTRAAKGGQWLGHGLGEK